METVLNHKTSTNELLSHSKLTNYPTELFTLLLFLHGNVILILILITIHFSIPVRLMINQHLLSNYHVPPMLLNKIQGEKNRSLLDQAFVQTLNLFQGPSVPFLKKVRKF